MGAFVPQRFPGLCCHCVRASSLGRAELALRKWVNHRRAVSQNQKSPSPFSQFRLYGIKTKGFLFSVSVDPEQYPTSCNHHSPKHGWNGATGLLWGWRSLRQHVRKDHQGCGSAVGRNANFSWWVPWQGQIQCAIGERECVHTGRRNVHQVWHQTQKQQCCSAPGK